MFFNEVAQYSMWDKMFFKIIFMMPYEIPSKHIYPIASNLLLFNLNDYDHDEVIEYFHILIGSMTNKDLLNFFKSVLMHMNANPNDTEIHSDILAMLLPRIERTDSIQIVTEYLNQQKAYQYPGHGIPLMLYHLTHPSIITFISTIQLDHLLKYFSTEISINRGRVTVLLGKIAILRPETKNSVVQIITDHEITDANIENMEIFKIISCTLATLNISANNEHLNAFINRLKELIDDPNESNNEVEFTKQFVAIGTLFSLRQYHDIKYIKNRALSILFKFISLDFRSFHPKNWELHFSPLYSVIEYLTDKEQINIAKVLMNEITNFPQQTCKLLLALPLFSNDMLIQKLYRLSFYCDLHNPNIYEFLTLKHDPAREWYFTIKYSATSSLESYNYYLNILSLTFSADTPEHLNNTDTKKLSTDLTVPDTISQLGQNKSKELDTDTATEQLSSLRLN